MRKILGKLLLSEPSNSPLVVKTNGTATGSALIYGYYVFFHTYVSKNGLLNPQLKESELKIPVNQQQPILLLALVRRIPGKKPLENQHLQSEPIL
jgi:hypothetical protein